MHEPGDFSFSADTFGGVARLFPLPNLVVFPQVMQPLHVFEPRYRALMEEALADDKLLTMALLAPGWEPNYEGRPALYPFGCLCRVATHQRLEDGCFNMLLLGLRRVRLGRELPATKSFRAALAEIADDEYPPQTAAGRPALQHRLVEAFKQHLPKVKDAGEQFEQLLGQKTPLGLLTDIVAYTLNLPIEIKHELLAETNVDRRAHALLKHLPSATIGPRGPSSAKFPPDFSAN